LAVRARSEGLAASDVDAALAARELVITWVNRGTLHLIRAEDYPLLQALTTPPLWTACQTRLRQTGVGEAAAERGVATVARSLADEGPLTRTQLKERLDSADVPTADLARWAGLPLRDARAGYAAIASQLTDLGDGLVDLRGREPVAPLPEPRLLGAFDPLLLGWASREDVVGRHQQLVTTNGIFRPFALVDGRAVATWRLPKGKVEIEQLERLTKKAAGRLEADATAVEAFLTGRPIRALRPPVARPD
jgi:hypothetical protein